MECQIIKYQGFSDGYVLSLTAYGWKETFPYEVSKGDEVNLTVGYIKGSAPGRLLLEVDYNPEGKKYALEAIEMCLD